MLLVAVADAAFDDVRRAVDENQLRVDGFQEVIAQADLPVVRVLEDIRVQPDFRRIRRKILLRTVLVVAREEPLFWRYCTISMADWSFTPQEDLWY